MTKPSIIIVGPAGCGKTRNAEALRRHYGLREVLDTGASLERSHYRVPAEDTLVLTTGFATLWGSTGVRVIGYDEAMSEAGL